MAERKGTGLAAWGPHGAWRGVGKQRLGSEAILSTNNDYRGWVRVVSAGDGGTFGRKWA